MVKKATAAVPEAAPAAQAGIFFELETLAVRGRKTIYEVFKKVLAERDAELTPILFSRYCLATSPRRHLAELMDALGKGRFSADKILEEFRAGVLEAFAAKKTGPDAALMRLLQDVPRNYVACGAISGLPLEEAEILATHLGLAELGVQLQTLSFLDHDYPSTDVWVRSARQAGVPTGFALALVSSALSCKTALAAGMHCVAIPDEYTAFQDYSGADAIMEKIDEKAIRELLPPLKV